MKYLNEYRDPELIHRYLKKLHQLVSRQWTIMEICGGQTHSLVKNGLLELLPEEIIMIHGPGCPVCVTPMGTIDKAIQLAHKENVTICSFGDMLRVPGSRGSLLEAKAKGADIRVYYSPLEAVDLARANPQKEVVFLAVGFETTTPANALSVLQAHQLGLSNYSVLTSQVRLPPAMEAILNDDRTSIQGFLGAGHVSVISGVEEYLPIATKYQVPIVMTGFEPVDILQGIFMVVEQLENGRYEVGNQYSRAVKSAGNREALRIVNKILEISDQDWRGIGMIPSSGYRLKQEYHQYDAEKKFALTVGSTESDKQCLAGEILRGIIKPMECPFFGTLCTPDKPMGAPMVSSEGACAAYYQFAKESHHES